jgi:thiol:disulfide interchange protein DsbD
VLAWGAWLALVAPAGAEEVSWRIATTAKGVVAPGAVFRVDVTAHLEDGWHVYSITQPPGGPVTTTIQFARDGVFSLAGAIESPPPDVAYDPNFGIDTETHEGPVVVFGAPVQVAATAPAGRHPLVVHVRFQACTDRMCLPPAVSKLELDVETGTRPAAAQATGTGALPAQAASLPRGTTPRAGDTSSAGTATPPASTPVTGGPESAPVAASPAAPPASDSAPARPPVGQRTTAAPPSPSRVPGGSLPAFLWLAATMGLLSLLTPCVFPMVPITVSYFTKHAATSRRGAVGLAGAYGLGIVLTFAALGTAIAIVAGAAGLNRFAANPWLNLGIAALFIVFALNLFGAFELRLPSRWATALDASGRSPRAGRLGGAVLMGLTFTVTSFTCTAAFIGTLLVLAAQGAWQWPLVGMLVYASVFAAPFVVLALVPQLAAQLPRAGGWLTTVKVSMGLLEIAAAMKFLSNVDVVWAWGVFTRDLVLASWVAVALLLALYLAGLVRLHHEGATSNPGPWRLVSGLLSLTLGIWMATGLLGWRLGELEAFLPPAIGPQAEGPALGGPAAELPWIINDYEGALGEARREARAVFVDFTGYTCTNCRWMEANMFPRTAVRRELERFVRVRLYTDGEGEPYLSQQRMQQERFGTVALPLYAILRSDGTVVATFAGLTRDEAEFLRFLRSS